MIDTTPFILLYFSLYTVVVKIKYLFNFMFLITINSNQGLVYNKEEMGYNFFKIGYFLKKDLKVIYFIIIYELYSNLCTYRPSL